MHKRTQTVQSEDIGKESKFLSSPLKKYRSNSTSNATKVTYTDMFV